MKAFRKRHGLSQAKLAEKAGLSQPNICGAETGSKPASEALEAKVRKVMARLDKGKK
jgi:transcriptional regulator with XRE-family HTH domain